MDGQMGGEREEEKEGGKVAQEEGTSGRTERDKESGRKEGNT